MDDEKTRYKQDMMRRKARQDAAVAARKITEKGLLIVNTGPGKGKSTAAFGLAMRMMGHGFRVGIVQFIKGTWDTGEKHAFKRFDDLLTWRTSGEGFTWETQDRDRDIAAAQAGWRVALELMADPEIRMVVLDELNVALAHDQLSIDEVVAALQSRRPSLHVVVTGRNAKPEMIAAADLVSEVAAIKHPFAVGVQAQKGVEF